MIKIEEIMQKEVNEQENVEVSPELKESSP